MREEFFTTVHCLPYREMNVYWNTENPINNLIYNQLIWQW